MSGQAKLILARSDAALATDRRPVSSLKYTWVRDCLASECGEQRQRRDRHVCALSHQRQRVFQSKERNLEFRI